MAGLDTRGLADGFMKGFSFVDGYYDKEQQKERQAQLDQEQRDYRAQQQANWDRNFGLQEQRAETQDKQWQQSFGLQQQRFGADQQHQSWQRGRANKQDALDAADRQRTQDLQDIQIELARLAQGFEPTERGIELFSSPKYQQYNPLRIASPDMGEALSYAEQVIDPNSPADTNSPEGRKHLNYVLMPDLNTGRNGEGLKGGVRQFAALYPGQTEGTVAVEVEMEDGRLAPVTEKRGTAEDGDDAVLEEPVEKLVNQVQGLKTLRQALTSPQGQQGVARLRQALGLSSAGEAQELQTIYDADGNEMKVQWDRTSGRWVPVGGSKQKQVKHEAIKNFDGTVTAFVDPYSREVFPANSGASEADQELLMQQAGEYADKQISDRAGWTSTDKTDFAQFGGDRTIAREYYMRQYLQMMQGGQQAPVPNPIRELEADFGKR